MQWTLSASGFRLTIRNVNNNISDYIGGITEGFRLTIRNVNPKYGNDDDRVDEIAF